MSEMAAHQIICGLILCVAVLGHGVHSQPTPAFSSFPPLGGTPPITGQCEFPSSWQQGKQWWRGYVSADQEISPRGINYVYETFSTNSITSFEKISPGQEKDVYRCLTSGRRDGKSYIYVLIDKKLNFNCREYMEVDNVLLVRWIFSGRVPGTFPSVSECASRLASMSSFEVLPLLNAQTGEVAVQDCPLLSGEYSTEITEHSADGPQVYCKDRPDSVTSIDKSKVDIKSCRHTNTFSQPYYSELLCMANWDGDVFGSNFGSVAASDKSVLFFYRNKNSNFRPHFFIGRYRTEGQGVLTLSVYVADTKKITGVLTAKADEQSIAYRIFSLKRIGDVKEAKNPGPVSPTADSVSANCNGECINGICQQNSGLWQCTCKEGYDGVNCERALTVGSCSDKPCENGACDQQGRYYYCRCLEGFTGINCDMGQYCLPNPCHRGQCMNYQGGFKCLCPDGFTGRVCAENVVAEKEEDQKVTIILSTLLSVFVIGIVVIAIIICQCKRKKDEKSIPANADGELPNQTYSSMTSWFPDYKRELAAAEEANSP